MEEGDGKAMGAEEIACKEIMEVRRCHHLWTLGPPAQQNASERRRRVQRRLEWAEDQEKSTEHQSPKQSRVVNSVY